MKLMDVIRRQLYLNLGQKREIPWNDPDFSRRMLQEHLSQEHDAASRRFEIIEKHVDWIHHQGVIRRACQDSRLGLWPRLYTSRLAKLGHECVGIDFSPASITYASECARPKSYRMRLHSTGHPGCGLWQRI